MNHHSAFDFLLGLAGVFIAVALIGGGIFFALKRSDDPARLAFRIIFTIPFAIVVLWFASKLFVFGPFLLVFMAVVLSYVWAPQLGEWIASPFTNLFAGGHERPEDKPFYSIAVAQRKKGNYSRAIEEVRRQLEKFPGDFEGVMLLAGIQAENLNDLPAAETTLNRFCARPDAPDAQVAAAWTTMADWHLKFGVDVDSARASLEEILARFPGTELALKAETRIAHLTDTEKILLAQHDRQAVPVPEGVPNIGLLDSTEFLKPKEIEPERLAAEYVKHLESHPHDAGVREKLATIYARDFKRLDLASQELARLVDEPRHSPKQVAAWLNLLATFQVELGADLDTVRATLEQIIDKFPDLPPAEIARRRLFLLKNEFKGKEATSTVPLGEYEQNIGLKYGPPRKP